MPHYEELTMEQIIEKFGDNEAFMKHLPDRKEIYKLPRQWLVNVAYTVIGAEFEQWMRAKINERNQKMAESKDLMVAVDP